MRMALDEARQADFPFGAVIVRDGQVIARGRNLGRTNDDPTAHGEMVAIRRCLADHGSAALKGSTLYTSGEPCVMCMGAIVWCRFGRLVFAASVEQIAARMNQIMISSADIAAKETFLPIKITGGVLADEAVQTLRQIRIVWNISRARRADQTCAWLKKEMAPARRRHLLRSSCRASLVVRHRLAVVDGLMVRLDIGVVVSVLETVIVPRELGRAVAVLRHLRLVGCLGTDLGLRLAVGLGGRRLGRRRRSPGLR